MFCKKCGKQIDYDSTVCHECEAKANATVEEIIDEPITTAESTAEDTGIPTGVAYKPTHTNENPYVAAQTTVDGGKVLQTSEIKIEIAENPAPNEEGEQDDEIEKPKGNRMHGFGPALTAVILGVVGYLVDSISGYVTGISSILTMLANLGGEAEMGSKFTTGGIVANLLIGAACCAVGIVALVLGTKSIKAFKQHKNETGTKPIATLILGIAGTVLGALGIWGFVDNIASVIIYAASTAASNVLNSWVS